MGEGASHSWTWFVDVLDRAGLVDLELIDHQDIEAGRLNDFSVYIMGGGDAFAMAYGLGPEGAGAIRRFVEQGGTYVGACAGTYLMLNMDLYPLSLFSMCPVKVNNIVEELPPCLNLWEKFYTPYGGRYVLHPARGPVRLDWQGQTKVVAPLYGGPPMLVPAAALRWTLPWQARILATYEDFQAQTIFLTWESIAREMILGQVAALETTFPAMGTGGGKLLLFGPHFEEPHFPEANQILIRLLLDATQRDKAEGGPKRQFEPAPAGIGLYPQELRQLKGAISEARIVTVGLETVPIHWLIGAKTYEPEKIRTFLESIWERISWLETSGMLDGDGEILRSVVNRGQELVGRLISLRNGVLAGEDTSEQAASFFPFLKQLTADFLKIYLHRRQASPAEPQGSAPPGD